MKNIYFDLCAIPIYLIIIWAAYSRKMVRGRANRVFLMMNILSLVCAALDILMECVVNPLPLPHSAVVIGTGISFLYKVIRNASLVVYLIYVFHITRTENRLRPMWAKALLWGPNFIVAGVLLQNFFTHNVFQVTELEGYARGPLLNIVYVVALLYGLFGLGYCIYCRRHLVRSKWIALLSVYVLIFVAVFIQFINPDLMVEMFSTALGILLVMLLVVRPGESMDESLSIRNWATYQTDLRNVLLSRSRVQIIVIQLINAQELRSYLGENRFNQYLGTVMDEFRRLCSEEHLSVDIYLERPGIIYLIPEDEDLDISSMVDTFLKSIRSSLASYENMGLRFEPKICQIRYPEDLGSYREILNLGHRFPQLGAPGQVFFPASEIMKSKDFEMVNHMEKILYRAINEDTLEMYYQPIFDVKTQSFRFAEALARVKDPEYGMISPALFIPAAEKSGMILKLGEKVVETVFRFIAEHDLQSLGLRRIEINLSVSQMLQQDLPRIIRRLQEEYGISPEEVNFEITESIFDNLSQIMEQNVNELTRMGYSFSLDDYGVGYSNIQRLSRMPLDIIKVDKSLVDDMFTESGRVILENTVLMMRGIRKELVIEGVETEESTRVLMDLKCDYIQGYYYSRPLPQEEFVEFLKERNPMVS